MTIPADILQPTGGLTPAALLEIEGNISALSDELHTLQQVLHANPELAWEEHTAHEACVAYMSKQPGWTVTPHAYGIDTAWEAVYEHGTGGPVVGFNSEMDALPGIGHACGHNLICITGIGAALGTAQFLREHNLPGKIQLLGTPAEEAGGGKVVLLKKGAYDAMDLCMMAHPMGRGNGSAISYTACMAAFTVSFKGASAHACANPAAGKNALDAAVAAYTNVALLRQQIPDSNRIYITLKGGEQWACNVIAADAKIQFGVRAPSGAEVAALIPRALDCMKAGALAAGCEIDIAFELMYLDSRHADGLVEYMGQACGDAWGDSYVYSIDTPSPGATDFGDVCYAVPGIHPMFGLPDAPVGDFPHSDNYTNSTGTRSATAAALKSAATLAWLGARAAADAKWLEGVKETWTRQMDKADKPKMLARLEAILGQYRRGEMAGKAAGLCEHEH